MPIMIDRSGVIPESLAQARPVHLKPIRRSSALLEDAPLAVEFVAAAHV